MSLIGDREPSAVRCGPWTADCGLWTSILIYSRPLKLIFFSALTFIRNFPAMNVPASFSGVDCGLVDCGLSPAAANPAQPRL